jgi:uncharacterized protein (TIGR03437 family)
VTPTHPAQIGETVALYVSGLGDVTPAVSDGTPGPVNPLSMTTNTIAVYIGGQKAATSFIGLAPQLIGLYQINVQVPTGVSGNALVDVAGPDFYTSQAVLPIGSGSTGSTGISPPPAPRIVPRRDGSSRVVRSRRAGTK